MQLTVKSEFYLGTVYLSTVVVMVLMAVVMVIVPVTPDVNIRVIKVSHAACFTIHPPYIIFKLWTTRKVK